MSASTALVITSIASADHPVLNDFAKKCAERNIPFLVIGDRASPAEFKLDGCDFYNLARQKDQGLSISAILPEKHYGRKNIGYLLAIRNGANIILETDDDNYARDPFWNKRSRKINAHPLDKAGWVNIYSYYTSQRIWPRGFALEFLQNAPPSLNQFPKQELDCPIQQGLADENPDVDAIYRLILPLPVSFEKAETIGIGRGTWCPFNSQNTTWFKDAFPLLYLPSYCSFRMTDIWRSFVAQRIAWENNWHILFHEPTVYQERNMHNLIRDFADEVSGYVNNHKIAENLASLTLQSGTDKLGENLYRCYEELVRMSLVDAMELPLIEAWNADLKSMK